MRGEIQNLLIRVLCDVTVNCGDLSYLKEISDVEKLLLLARHHQLEHIVAYALGEAGISGYESAFYSSLAQTTRQTHAIDGVRRALSEKGIPFIVLKGAVMRSLYPSPWMRNSCDVDVLVKEEDLCEAGKVLESLSYERLDGLSAHDVTYKKADVHIELHYTLIEEYRLPTVAEVLKTVWQHASCAEGSEHILDDAFYYFYHIAHMVKHFEGGGSGVRSLLDVWFLGNRMDGADKQGREELLSRGGILKFATAAEQLSENWFSGSDYPVDPLFEEFIFTGGAYGRRDNSVAVKKTQKGGRFAYLMHRLFVPYGQLSGYYPSLKKCPLLFPFYQVRRWIDAMRRNGKGYAKELSENMKKDEREDGIKSMLSSLGL